MKKLNDIDTICFDVDDTLIMWTSNPSETDQSRIIVIKDQYGDVICIPHQKHIDLLKKYKQNGKNIVVWSQGGSDWAEIVVNKLGLQDYVDIIIPKPTLYYDDLDVKVWFPSNDYREFE